MNIPEKANDAAVKALFEDGCGEPKTDAATVLEAAAPFIAAQALRDAARKWDNDMAQHFEYRTYDIANEIENWADELDPQ